MNKHFLSFIVLITLSFSSFAQDGYSIRQLNDMVGQLEWTRATNKNETNISGSPYLQDDFNAGNVYYDGKYKVENIPLRLNLYNDEFEYKEKNTVMSFAKPARIDKIEIGDEIYIYLEKSNSKKVSGFVKKWHADFPAVLSKMEVEFLKKEEAKPYVEPKPDRFERKTDKHYIMKSESEIEKITSVKKLIKFLGNHTEELTEYAKKQKVSSGDPEELAGLLDYYHGL